MKTRMAVAVIMSITVATFFANTASAGSITLRPDVPTPTALNLAFNYSSAIDAVNTTSWSNPGIVLRPSTAQYASTSTWSGLQSNQLTGQKLAVSIGGAYNVGAVEFAFGRWSNTWIPATYDLYAASSNVANLYQPAYKIGDQSSPGITFSDRSPAGEAQGMRYQQIRYDLAAPQQVYKYGIVVNSWSALGTGADNRAFIMASSAYASGTLTYDGQVSVFHNPSNPGGTANWNGTNVTNNLAVYGLDKWSGPRYYVSSSANTIILHLADTYSLKGIRWSAGQVYYPTAYQIYVANYDGAGNPAAGDWQDATGALTGANQGVVVPFTGPFVGNWVKLVTTSANNNLLELTNINVYGSFAPEPASLALLALGGLALLRRRK